MSRRSSPAAGLKMHELSARQLLDIWDRGAGKRATGRALLLLGEAFPEIAGAEIAAWSVGRRDRRLLELRQRVFGSRIAIQQACPNCDQVLESEFDAGTLRAPEPGAVAERFEHGSYLVGWRAPDSTDLARAETLGDPGAARDFLIERCVVEAWRGGQSVPARDLPPETIEALGQAIERADPQARTELALQCPACGEAFTILFDIVSFFWSELNTMAKRLVAEVHELARAYGWSEREILALSPARRRAYLELVAR